MKRSKSLVFIISSILIIAMGISGCAKKSDMVSTSTASTEVTQATEAEETTADQNILNSEEGAYNTLMEFYDGSKENLAKKRAGAEDTLIVGYSSFPSMKILPIEASSVYDRYFTNLIFTAMVIPGPDAQPVFNYATAADRVEISEDKLTYTYYLKKNMKFSDGTPVTSKDVAFTYTATCDPSYDGRYIGNALNLVGYKEYYAEGKLEDSVDTLEGIKIIDDYTISFTYIKPLVENIWNLGDLNIMPEHIYGFEKGNYQKVKDLMARNVFIGSDRYTFVESVEGQYVALEANPNWHGGKVNIKNFIYKEVTTETQYEELSLGNIDVLLQVPSNNDSIEKLSANGAANIMSYTDNAYGFMMYNLRDERLADINVRHALVYGFNRQQFIDLYYNGYGIVPNVPSSPASWSFTNDVTQFEYNPEKAKQLLEDAGWKVGADGIREKDGLKLEFVWDTYNTGRYVPTLTPLLQKDWLEIGVKITPNLQDFSAMIEKVFDKQDFTMTNLSWSLTADPSDARSTFHGDYLELGSNNAGGLNDPDVNRLFDEGSGEFDQTKRVAIYQKLYQRINELQPYMLISTSLRWDAFNPRVIGFNPSSFCNFTYGLEHFELEK